MLRHAPPLLLALALVSAPALGHADLYRWVDEQGVSHYSSDRDTVPRSFRDEAQVIRESPAPVAAPRAAPAPPEVTPPPLPSSAPETASPELAPPAPIVFPGPAATLSLAPEDPRAAEVAELEAKIASDRERLRQMISTKRWDSAELASDPIIREIAERLPRLQAELAALRAETVP